MCGCKQQSLPCFIVHHCTMLIAIHDYFTSGFDPWDVSQQGLADLLETEAEEQRRPPSKPLTNGVREHSFSALPNRTASKGHHDPWQDEFRALFPDVNVSFGGKLYTQYTVQRVIFVGQNICCFRGLTLDLPLPAVQSATTNG